MRTIFLKKFSKEEIERLVQRSAIRLEKILPPTRKILEQVRKRGDNALKEYMKKFDGVILDTLWVTDREVSRGIEKIAPKTKRAFRTAARNIEKFHRAQFVREKRIQTTTGVMCWREWRPIERVGLYIPKGLPSTVLMLGIPAKIAGCEDIILCTPPKKDGILQKEILFAAKLVGVKKIFKVGGAQAIGAMGYGTQTIPRVNKIFGPGNQYVTAAKLLVSIDAEGASIDMPAGPSEVLVIADAYADPSFVAADLLGQTEHGPDSPFVLLTNDEPLVSAVKREIQKQIGAMPPLRRNLVSASLKESKLIIVRSIAKAVQFANSFAPEHLIVNVKNAEKYVAHIKNAGSVFIGKYASESLGDYASGTNHSLPTMGYARSLSGVSIDSFVKKITFQTASQKGLVNIAPIVEALADAEQMAAHKNAVTVRLERRNTY